MFKIMKHDETWWNEETQVKSVQSVCEVFLKGWSVEAWWNQIPTAEKTCVFTMRSSCFTSVPLKRGELLWAVEQGAAMQPRRCRSPPQKEKRKRHQWPKMQHGCDMLQYAAMALMTSDMWWHPAIAGSTSRAAANVSTGHSMTSGCLRHQKTIKTDIQKHVDDTWWHLTPGHHSSVRVDRVVAL